MEGGECTAEERQKHANFVSALVNAVRRDLHFQHYSEDGRLPLSVKILYGAPTLVHQAGAALMIQLYALVFYENLGMPIAIQAAILAVARSVDVVSDPSMSYITDNLSSSMGRRRPFMISGCWFYSASLIALFTPPENIGSYLTLWFGGFYIMFYLSSTYCGK
jgi:GPH family glycoside/pentoside/hexuronide:cation symporter